MSAAVKICYADPTPSAEGYNAAAGRAAELGFDCLVVPSPLQSGKSGNRMLAAMAGAAFEARLAALCSACQAAGVHGFVDVVLDRVAAGSELAKEGPFLDPSPQLALDPRRAGNSGVAQADADPGRAASALGAWWGGKLRAWQQAGLVGVRLLGLDRLGDPAGVVRALRAAAPGLVLFGWTPGVPRGELARLAGVGLDLVAASLPWWNWRNEWFWDEYQALRRIAPVVMAPEAPFGPRLATAAMDPVQAAATLRRAIGLAAGCSGPWMMVQGAERGTMQRLDAWHRPEAEADRTPARLTGIDLAPNVAALNRAPCVASPVAHIEPLSASGAPVLALMLSPQPDLRRTPEVRLLMVNTRTDGAAIAQAETVLPASRGSFGAFHPVFPSAAGAMLQGREIVLAPGEASIYEAQALPEPARPALDRQSAVTAAQVSRVCIENPSPCVEDGQFGAKRLLGELVSVQADIITDGHDKLAAVMRWQLATEDAWHEVAMLPLGNDRWAAPLALEALGTYRFDILAWRDVFASFRDELSKKYKAGLPLVLELQEGRALLDAASRQAEGALRPELSQALLHFDQAGPDDRRDMMLSDDMAALMRRADARPHMVRLPRPILIECERTGAAFGSWYEVFPRSLSDDPARHGTFADVQRHLPRVAAMGFDVLYFPPFHPIGRVNRKGKNNALRAEPGDCGSPYAIGAVEGGHDALHPELGTLEDFARLRQAAAGHGLELAMDFAIQCSPDHPWLKEHPDWFVWRPDGTMRYAENPPKKYEDIVNVDFYAPGSVPGLWMALCEAVLFWASQGVRLFRVDNPHTKPLPFWHWMIREVRARYPDAVFLSEAFTRPKVMYRLAKVGFSQSYTYFTWRTKKWEFEQYLTELTQGAPREVFRPHFFVNTPDINPTYLHGAGRQVFLTRAAMAATLSGLWGVYNGFELCEGTPVATGKEEYLDSEKYEIRAWDWDRPGNIVPEITQLNRIRRFNPALHSHLGVDFLEAPNDQVLYYEKSNPDRSNVLLIAVSMDANAVHEVDAALPFWKWGLGEGDAFGLEDLVTGARDVWRGKWHRLRLTPEAPYIILRVHPSV